jgi:asparagine synthase (glutamine-hydrolysing)
MCGIAAIVSPDVNRSSVLPAMIDVLEHRGPDARGVKSVDGCTLGHARLSIIDLSSGAQPMSAGAERYWIVYNGELYNFLEIREELEQRGRAFRTRSDTEVIIAAYDEWGRACLDRFRGMFAFALWDTQRRALFAARDLFGEKPLYFAPKSDGTLVIASEIRAILASGLVDAAIDRVSADAFLTYGYVPPDRTIYRGVATVPPAHSLEWRDGRTAVEPYWQPRIGHRRITMDEAAEELRHMTARAVKRQMISDVPIGAFLSGGLDSSTIVALMQMQSAQPVKTFSVGFGRTINELPYARAVARRYGTEHHEIDLGEIDVPPLIARMARVYDEPFADTSHIPTFLVAQYARRFVTVVLSGDGGDELFGGYGWYGLLQRSQRFRFAARPQWLLLRSASKALRDRWSTLRDVSNAAGLAARWNDLWTRGVMVHTVMRPPLRRRLWGAGAPAPYEPLAYKPDDTVSGLDRSFYFDLRFYLAGDILTKVDRAAMANSLETRAPFLDRDVAELALSLPSSLKVSAGDSKRVMREAFRDLWPEEIRNRPKQGFGSPIGRWMEHPAMQELIQRAAAPDSRLRQLLPGVTAGDLRRTDYAGWILLTLALWLDAHEVTL